MSDDLYSERERIIREHLATLPPLTERERQIQRLSFTYGNLACTTNHKPSKSAFRRAALDTGVPEDVYDEWAARVAWERP